MLVLQRFKGHCIESESTFVQNGYYYRNISTLYIRHTNFPPGSLLSLFQNHELMINSAVFGFYFHVKKHPLLNTNLPYQDNERDACRREINAFVVDKGTSEAREALEPQPSVLSVLFSCAGSGRDHSGVKRSESRRLWAAIGWPHPSLSCSQRLQHGR